MRLLRWASRHRSSLADAVLVASLLCAVAALAWEVDIFDGGTRSPVKTLDLPERLLLATCLAAGLLFFALRRFVEQRREAQFRAGIQRQTRLLAFEDVLTGLQNRRRFDEALAAAVASPPGASACHAVLLLDLNGFKQVNDLHGHPVGDAVLAVVAQRLLGAVKAGDLVCRFGGDEFAILALHVSGPTAAAGIALRIVECLAPPVQTGTLAHRIGAGVGIALMPDDAATAVELLRKADVALYRAKALGGSAIRFFEAEMDRGLQERARLTEALRQAVLERRVEPRFQPVVDLRSRQVVAFEAVPTWHDPTLGDVPPHAFWPLAEECGMAADLALQLLRASCEVAVRWPDRVGLSIDVMPSQLADAELPAKVADILQATGLAAARLELEIAESLLVRDLNSAKDILGRLRGTGVRIALDHFGTGYSSLYHLRNFKVDRVKIDRGFVEAMGRGESTQIVEALVGLGLGLGLQVTADGVGTAAQRASLLQSGCGQGQGAMFSTPLSVPETVALFGPQPSTGFDDGA